MRRYFVAAVVAWAILGSQPPAHAGWLIRGVKNFWTTAVQNNRWPEPWVYPDRTAVSSHFCVMTQNGWRRQNTLTDAHFDASGKELSEAGRLKIRWITTQAPSQARTIWVLRTDDPELTAVRIAKAQESAAHYAQGDVVPEVLETIKAYESTPADYVDVIDRKFRETTPDPRLPEKEESDANAQ